VGESLLCITIVMAGPGPAIHVLGSRRERRTWITGTSPVMKAERSPSLDSRPNASRLLAAPRSHKLLQFRFVRV
jgi:hypothetical protein